ncbi:hypothetical protein SIO70_23060 [Chitinophaga sancti]|uniref:hypothetical protein n=1 Tax=Chitinophaga sancti TaxID=1004 RepID=UPI002A75DA33|nr:hypothetical protein [Chitinophaga sancti]WPQ61243.1 hypothetical protein SIO70_23060 [Chitinophaga sancti]
MQKSIISALFLAAVCACQTPKVFRYYSGKEDKVQQLSKPSDIKNYFSLNAFVLTPTAGSDKLITDLSDRGQQAIIESMNSKTKTSKELVSTIAGPISNASSAGNFKGSLIWKKRVVINITKVDKECANRLQQILIDIDIPSAYKDKVEYVSWDKIATEKQSIDLGKITQNNSTAYSFSPEIDFLGILQGKGIGSVSNTKSTTAEKSYTSRLAGLNAAIVNKNKLQIFQRALPNEDITGNIVIELTMRSKLSKQIEVYEFTGLYDGSMPIKEQEKVVLNKSILVEPNFGVLSADVPADITYDFRYRKVSKGCKTEPEYDDHITYLDGNITESGKFILFTKEDLDQSKTWSISDNINSLKIKKNGIITGDLNFDGIDKANQFLGWLIQTQNLKASDYDLLLGLIPLQKSDIKNLKVILN